MPARSKAQFRFMQGVAHGSISGPRGLSRSDAAEFVSGQSPKGLPDKKKPVQKKRRKKVNTLPYPKK